ncbi:MAG TPA: hypothetical protein VMV57_14225 [Terracidiphilus sp.]|nr:hypothetical protein [Terracidiphilus sp.]
MWRLFGGRRQREEVEVLNKEESRALRVKIRHVLMDQWDPIGVRDFPEAADEYDRYIGDVYELLMRRAVGRKIADYLRTIEVGRMGLTDMDGKPLMPDEKRMAAVEELLRLRG